MGNFVLTRFKLTEIGPHTGLVGDDTGIAGIGFGLAAIGVAGSFYSEAGDVKNPLISFP